jgi:hypothetical protein
MFFPECSVLLVFELWASESNPVHYVNVIRLSSDFTSQVLLTHRIKTRTNHTTTRQEAPGIVSCGYSHFKSILVSLSRQPRRIMAMWFTDDSCSFKFIIVYLGGNSFLCLCTFIGAILARSVRQPNLQSCLLHRLKGHRIAHSSLFPQCDSRVWNLSEFCQQSRI